MKRCLGSPGCNLNDVHTQCGRLSLGGVHDFCAHFTARRLWLGPHWGPGDSCRFWPGWNENERLIWKPWFHFFQGVWFQINESGSVSFPENVPKNPYLKGLPKIKWSKYRKKHSKLWSVLQHFLLCGLFRSVPCFCFGSCLGSWLPPHLYAPTTARRYLRAAPSSADVALTFFEVYWLRDWDKAAAEMGDGWKAGRSASCCLFWKSVKKGQGWDMFAVPWSLYQAKHFPTAPLTSIFSSLTVSL